MVCFFSLGIQQVKTALKYTVGFAVICALLLLVG